MNETNFKIPGTENVVAFLDLHYRVKFMLRRTLQHDTVIDSEAKKSILMLNFSAVVTPFDFEIFILHFRSRM